MSADRTLRDTIPPWAGLSSKAIGVLSSPGCAVSLDAVRNLNGDPLVSAITTIAVGGILLIAIRCLLGIVSIAAHGVIRAMRQPCRFGMASIFI